MIEHRGANLLLLDITNLFTNGASIILTFYIISTDTILISDRCHHYLWLNSIITLGVSLAFKRVPLTYISGSAGENLKIINPWIAKLILLVMIREVDGAGRH